jgi:hypothetical protein
MKGQRNQEQALGSKSAKSCGLGSTLLLKIVALQLVDLGEHCLSVPPVMNPQKGLLL